MMAAPAALPPIDPAALARRRRGRNIAMLLILLGLVALFYGISMVKFAQHGLGG